MRQALPTVAGLLFGEAESSRSRHRRWSSRTVDARCYGTAHSEREGSWVPPCASLQLWKASPEAHGAPLHCPLSEGAWAVTARTPHACWGGRGQAGPCLRGRTGLTSGGRAVPRVLVSLHHTAAQTGSGDQVPPCKQQWVSYATDEAVTSGCRGSCMTHRAIQGTPPGAQPSGTTPRPRSPPCLPEGNAWPQNSGWRARSFLQGSAGETRCGARPTAAGTSGVPQHTPGSCRHPGRKAGPPHALTRRAGTDTPGKGLPPWPTPSRPDASPSATCSCGWGRRAWGRAQVLRFRLVPSNAPSSVLRGLRAEHQGPRASAAPGEGPTRAQAPRGTTVPRPARP